MAINLEGLSNLLQAPGVYNFVTSATPSLFDWLLPLRRPSIIQLELYNIADYFTVEFLEITLSKIAQNEYETIKENAESVPSFDRPISNDKRSALNQNSRN